MNKSFKVKLSPTKEQIDLFNRTFAVYRIAYNYHVDLEISFFDDACRKENETGEFQKKKFLSSYDLQKLWVAHKKTLGNFVHEVSSKAIEGASADVYSACSKFFDNARGKPPIRDKSKYNEKYCGPQATPHSKKDDLYLYIKEDGTKVYSLYYKSGGPRFKRKYSPISFPVEYKGLSIKDDCIYIPGINGSCKTKVNPVVKLARKCYVPTGTHHDANGTQYANPRISFDGIDWWFSVSTVVPDLPQVINKDLHIGVDTGVINSAILDDGTSYENHIHLPEYIRLDKRHTVLQSALDKKRDRLKKAGLKCSESKDYQFLKNRLRKIEIRLSNIKKDNLNNISKTIANKHAETIGLEMLDVEEMVATRAGTKNRKSATYKHWHKIIMNTGMYELQRQIAYKAEWRGAKVQKINQYFPSSQLCSVCGYKKTDLTLSDREWTCPVCGTHHDRDVNAATNIRNEAVRIIEANDGKIKKVLKERKKKGSKKVA